MTNLQVPGEDCEKNTPEIPNRLDSDSGEQPTTYQLHVPPHNYISKQSADITLDRDNVGTNGPSRQTNGKPNQILTFSKSLQWKGTSTQPPDSQTPEQSESKPGNNKLHPYASKSASNRLKLRPATPSVALHRQLNGTSNSRHSESNTSTPQPTLQHSLSSQSLSSLSSSSGRRSNGSASPRLSKARRQITCNRIPYDRSVSSLSKYHESCFPQVDPALVIGSAYRRLQNELIKNASKPRRRPISRYSEPEFNNRESVVNLVYSADLDAEQDELSRARASTEREARALRSGCFASGSFSRDFFHLMPSSSNTNANSRKTKGAFGMAGQRPFQHQSHLTLSVAGTDSSSDYPILMEEDRATSRFSHSRQSFTTTSELGVPISASESIQDLQPGDSEHSLPPSCYSMAPSPGGHLGRGGGFLYQVVTFDNLADNVPNFVRQNVTKTGRLSGESFILRLNHLRRRRALGETSGAISNNPAPTNNNSSKVKVSLPSKPPVSTSGMAGTGGGGGVAT